MDPGTAAILGTTVGSQVFGFLGAGQQAGATTEAAQIQANTAQKSLDFAKQVYEQKRADLAPYRDFGAGSMQGLGYLAGMMPTSSATTPTTPTPTTPTTTTTKLPTFPDLVNAGNQQINLKNTMNQTLNRLQQTQLQNGMPVTGLTQSQIDAMKNVGIDVTQPLNSRQVGVLFGPTSVPPQWAQDQYNQQLNAQAAQNRQRLGVSGSMGPLTPAQLLNPSNPSNTSS